MMMIASVLRCRFVWEDLVVSHIVRIHAISAINNCDPETRAGPQITDQRRYRYIHDVIAETAAVRPATRNETAITEWILNAALEHVISENAQP